jgi:hypothetical protein
MAAVEVLIARRVGNTYEDFRRLPVPGDRAAFELLSEGLPDGVYKVRAVATDDRGARVESPAEVELVRYVAHSPLVSDLAALVQRNDVTITGKVTDADGDLGSVEVTAGSHTVPATLANGSLTALLEDMPTGEHTAVVTARDDLEQTGSASEFSTYYLMYGREPW